MRNLFFLLFFSIAYSVSGYSNGNKLKVYTVKGSDSKKYLIIQSQNDSLKNRVKKVCAGLEGFTVLETEKPNSVNKPDFFLVSTHKKFMSRERAGKDCLIGVGSCLGGILFIQAAGTEASRTNTPNGFYAYSGNKFVDGGAACVPASLYLAGLGFGIKGLIELFLPRNKFKSLPPNASFDDVMRWTGLKIMNEKEFEISSDKDIYSGVVPYLLAEGR